MIRTAAVFVGTVALVLTGMSSPATAGGGGDGESCTQQHWRKVAASLTEDQSPYFREAGQADDDTTSRYFIRGERVVVRKRCGDFRLHFKPQDWRKLRTTNPVVEISTAQATRRAAADRCHQEWHRVIVRRPMQVTPTFTPDAPAEGDEGLHYFAGRQKVEVTKRCGDYRVRVRTYGTRWEEHTTDVNEVE